jgi:hypothetical protein
MEDAYARLQNIYDGLLTGSYMGCSDITLFSAKPTLSLEEVMIRRPELYPDYLCDIAKMAVGLRSVIDTGNFHQWFNKDYRQIVQTLTSPTIHIILAHTENHSFPPFKISQYELYKRLGTELMQKTKDWETPLSHIDLYR